MFTFPGFLHRTVLMGLMAAAVLLGFSATSQAATAVDEGSFFERAYSPHAHINVRVRDGRTGKPIAGARIDASAMFGNQMKRITGYTDTSGRAWIEVSNISGPVRVTVAVSANGYYPFSLGFTLRPSQTANLRFDLDRK